LGKDLARSGDVVPKLLHDRVHVSVCSRSRFPGRVSLNQPTRSLLGFRKPMRKISSRLAQRLQFD
jgi:hypothetical protein